MYYFGVFSKQVCLPEAAATSKAKAVPAVPPAPVSPVTPPAQAPGTPPKSAPAVPCKYEDEEKLNKELIAAVAAYQQGQVQAQHGVADQPDDHQQQEKYEYGWDGDTWWEKDLDNKDEEAWCYWRKDTGWGRWINRAAS